MDEYIIKLKELIEQTYHYSKREGLKDALALAESINNRHKKKRIIDPEDVRNARRRMGYSIVKFAEYLCVSKSTIERWESGNSRVLEPFHRRLINDINNMSDDDLDEILKKEDYEKHARLTIRRYAYNRKINRKIINSNIRNNRSKIDAIGNKRFNSKEEKK